MNRTKLLSAISIFIILLNVIRIVRFSSIHWLSPWPDPMLAIDGKNYIKGALDFAISPKLLNIPDIYHSPAYQIFLGSLLKLSDNAENMLTFAKLIQLASFFASILGVYYLGKNFFSKNTGLLASTIFSCSLSWLFYCNMLQYEVLAGALLLLLTAMELHSEKNTSPIYFHATKGLLIALLAWIQARYAILIFIPLFQLARTSSKRRMPVTYLIAAIIPMLLWSAYQSQRFGHFIFMMEGSHFRFHAGNNPNASGASFPYPVITEPSGWQFIVEQPGRFLFLVKERFLLLFGIHSDLWRIPPRSSSNGNYEKAASILACFLFFWGWFQSLKKDWKNGSISTRFGLYFIPIAIILPPLFVFASNRFLVPLIPLLALFQAYALLAFVQPFYHLRNPYKRGLNDAKTKTYE